MINESTGRGGGTLTPGGPFHIGVCVCVCGLCWGWVGGGQSLLSMSIAVTHNQAPMGACVCVCVWNPSSVFSLGGTSSFHAVVTYWLNLFFVYPFLFIFR